MKKLNKLMTQATIVSASVLAMQPQAVFADGDGGFQDAMTTFSPVLEKLQRPLSIGLNIVCFGLALVGVVLGVVSLVQSFQEENPNEAQQKKQKAIKSFIGGGIAICGVLIINVLLAMLGITSIFTA